MAYLTLVQAEMAGLDAESRRALIGDWLEPAWSVRARHAGFDRLHQGYGGPPKQVAKAEDPASIGRHMVRPPGALQ
jgi:hypothetical protein